MAAGPITLFDKSALESLNVDEAVWFQHFYSANITPLFYVEMLADLEKKVADGRTPEQVVGQLAHKTPIDGAMPNVHHERICLANLMGEQIETRGVPVVAGGRHVEHGSQKGIVYDEMPEFEAFNRWNAGKFLDIERDFARHWRASLQNIDLKAIYNEFRPLVAPNRPRTLAEVRARAEQELSAVDRGDVPLVTAFNLCNVPYEYRPTIRWRWEANHRPSLMALAPYAAHVATVELFFRLAIAADLIGRDGPSNHIDLAYLHYLPFCMVFASKDRLHVRTAPVFLRNDQTFIHGEDLKVDLRRLDTHYMQLPEEEREQGIWRIAPHPPLEGNFLVSQQWDRHLPRWREPQVREKAPISTESERALVRELSDALKAPESARPIDTKDADFVAIQRWYRVRQGKWRILPPGVENPRQ